MNFIKKYIHNKYFYTGLAFLVWWIFFDEESLVVQYDLNNVKSGLESQKEYYLEEIEKDNKAIVTLQNDTVQLERYAREKYLMKKDDEDVFVIIREGDE